MLKEINDVTKSLQSQKHKLADCRDELNVLIASADDERQITT